MSSLISADELSHETELVWLEDIDQLDYVRQSLDRLPTRSARPAYHRDGRMIGYAILAKSAPAEGVDPRTLEPRVKGYKTERSEGGPPSRAMQELGIQLPL